MRNGLWLAPALWVAVMVMACAQEPPAPTSGPIPYQRHEVIIPPVAPDVQNARDQIGGGGGLSVIGASGLVTFEETILESDTIARVEYLNSTTSVAYEAYDSTHGSWLALLEFRFRVHESSQGVWPQRNRRSVQRLGGYETRDWANEIASLHAPTRTMVAVMIHRRSCS